MFTTRPLELSAFKEYITCPLCKGYLVDCVKIDECLHTFCKSCLVNWLNCNAHCPICDIEVNRLKPWLNLRTDTTLQNIVNRIVPNLQKEEMRRRRKFYLKRSKLSKRDVDVPEVQSPVFEDDELFCFTLRPTVGSGSATLRQSDDSTDSFEELFVQALSSVPISVLVKFIRLKVAASADAQVQILAETDSGDHIPVPEELCLADVTQTLCWKAEEPFRLCFSVQDQPSSDSFADLSWATVDLSRCDAKSASRGTSENSNDQREEKSVAIDYPHEPASLVFSTPYSTERSLSTSQQHSMLIEDRPDRMIYYCLSLPGGTDGRQVASIAPSHPFVPVVINSNCIENHYHQPNGVAKRSNGSNKILTVKRKSSQGRPVKLCSPMKKYPTIRPKTTCGNGTEPSATMRRRLLVIRPGRLSEIKSVVQVRIRRQRRLSELLSHRITRFEPQGPDNSWTTVEKICLAVLDALVKMVANSCPSA